MEEIAQTQEIESNEVQENEIPENSESQIQENSYVPRETKIDINGHSLQVNELQLKELYGIPKDEQLTDKEFKTMVSAYKAHKTADLKSANASKQEKLVQEIAQLIQENPWELLRRAGYDTRELSEKHLAEILEEEMLPENEKELKRIRQENELLKKQQEDAQKKFEEEQLQILVQQEQQKAIFEINEALEGSKLPRTPDVIRRISNYLLMAEKKGIPVHPKQIIPLVEQDLVRTQSEILKSLDPQSRLQLLGEDVLKQIRQDDLARIKKPQSNGSYSGTQTQGSQTNKKITKDELRNLIKQRVRG